jgi:hypothetical protein
MNSNQLMNIEAAPPRRRMVLALGRGKSGKTLWVRWRAHPAVREAIEHGAGVAWMPALRSNLAADREIRSLIAFSKLGVEGQEPLVFKRLAMRMWLEKMETAFTPFSRELGLV